MRFNYMGPNNEIYTEVKVNPKTKRVKIRNHTDDPFDRAFGVKEDVTYEDVMQFLESRTFPRNRAGIEDILEVMELEEYDAYKMCKYAEGRMAHDEKWIKFM